MPPKMPGKIVFPHFIGSHEWFSRYYVVITGLHSNNGYKIHCTSEFLSLPCLPRKAFNN